MKKICFSLLLTGLSLSLWSQPAAQGEWSVNMQTQALYQGVTSVYRYFLDGAQSTAEIETSGGVFYGLVVGMERQEDSVWGYGFQLGYQQQGLVEKTTSRVIGGTTEVTFDRWTIHQLILPVYGLRRFGRGKSAPYLRLGMGPSFTVAKSGMLSDNPDANPVVLNGDLEIGLDLKGKSIRFRPGIVIGGNLTPAVNPENQIIYTGLRLQVFPAR